MLISIRSFQHRASAPRRDQSSCRNTIASGNSLPPAAIRASRAPRICARSSGTTSWPPAPNNGPTIASSDTIRTAQ